MTIILDHDGIVRHSARLSRAAPLNPRTLELLTPQSHPHQDAYTDSHANADPDADQNPHANAHQDADADSDSDADALPDSQSHAERDPDGERHTVGNWNLDLNFHLHGHCHREAALHNHHGD